MAAEALMQYGCQMKVATIRYPESADELNKYWRDIAAELEEREDADNLLVAAQLMEFVSPGEAKYLLDLAWQLYPQNRVIAWNRLRQCRSRSDGQCDIDAISTDALRVDGSNGAVWLQIALLRLSQGDEEAATNAMRRAATAPHFESYFIAEVTIHERVLSTLADRSFQERVFEGMGSAGTRLMPYGDLFEYCRAAETGYSIRVELCDQVGERMATGGPSLHDRAIGYALRRSAANQSGDISLVAAATDAEEKFRQWTKETLNNREAQALLENDERVLRQYFATFTTYGEIEALTRLQAEYKRLKQEPDYDQCNFVPQAVLTEQSVQ